MGQAVAKVLSPADEFRGTAFAISRDLALTAFHCIGDRVSGKIILPAVSLQFLDGTTRTAVSIVEITDWILPCSS
jgi:hypothetical protein